MGLASLLSSRAGTSAFLHYTGKLCCRQNSTLLQRYFWHFSVCLPCLVSSAWFRLLNSGYLAKQLPFADIHLPLWTTTLLIAVTSATYQNFIPNFPKCSHIPTTPSSGKRPHQDWVGARSGPAAATCLLQGSAPARNPTQASHLPEHFVCPSCSLPWGSRLCSTRAHIMFHPFATQ